MIKKIMSRPVFIKQLEMEILKSLSKKFNMNLLESEKRGIENFLKNPARVKIEMKLFRKFYSESQQLISLMGTECHLYIMLLNMER